MGKLISSINISADGFCGHEDVVADEEHHLFATQLLNNAGQVLLGRKTFQLFESFWPYAENDTSLPAFMRNFAKLINEKPKIVVTGTLRDVQWNNSSVLPHLNQDIINEFKRSSNGHSIIFGSPGMLSGLTTFGVIDEYWISVQPVFSGKGIRLFDELQLQNRKDLILSETKTFGSGVVNLCYRIKESQRFL